MMKTPEHKGRSVGTMQKHSWRWIAGLAVMGVFYVATGINHSHGTATYLAIMPPYIPWPTAMVYVSGVAEIPGGIGVLAPDGFVLPRIRAFAAW